MRKVRIAVAQLQGYWPAGLPTAQKLTANMREFKKRVKEAVALSPDLIVVGEAFNRNNIPAAEWTYKEDLASGAIYRAARDMARKGNCWIAYGVSALHEGKQRNAAVLVDRRGRVAGVYHKVHLTQNDAARGTVPGDSFPTFETDFGRVGILVCHDMSFPESARCLMLNGAEILLWPTMWSGWGTELTRTIIRSRCIDNSVCLVMASVGQNPEAIKWVADGVKSLSAIYDFEGNIVAQKTDRLPGVVCGEVDLDFKRVAPNFTRGEQDLFREAVLRDRRPEVYRDVIGRAK